MSSYEVKAKRRVIVSQEREKDSKITPAVDQVSGKDGKVYRIENGMVRNQCKELARKLTDHWSQQSELFNFRDIRIIALFYCYGKSFKICSCIHSHVASIYLIC